MSIEKTIKVCEICGKEITTWDINHEENCKRKKAQELEDMRIRREIRERKLEESRKAAISNKAIVLLCRNELFEDAEKLCWDLFRWSDWDNGCCSMSEELVKGMISAVKEFISDNP